MMPNADADQPAHASPIFAALLSLLWPGLGQIYARAWKRGLSLLLGVPAQAALFYGVTQSYAIAAQWLIFSVSLVGMIWLWNVWDAYLTAKGAKSSAAAPVLLIIALNLVAAWIVTDIRVPKLHAQQRSVIRRILSGLACPDFVARKTKRVEVVGKYIVLGPGAPRSLEQETDEKTGPHITLTPIKVVPQEIVTVWGRNFARDKPGKLLLLGANEVEVGTFRTDDKGRFKASFVNPRDIPGSYFVRARQVAETGGWQISETLADTAPRMLETIYLALVGTALALVFALPLSFFGARNLMSGALPLRLIYGLTRGLFTVLRSVEVLIIAVIAVAAVGIGPFAGVLALAIHGVGALGKLYSEAIESIEHGPIEAIRSTGANELQVVIYGVVPQVVPQFIAFTLYRWDINVRMATVIGLVGGGGIGYQLIQYMNLLQWRQAATAIWLIAGVVMLMDYASAVIRERIV